MEQFHIGIGSGFSAPNRFRNVTAIPVLDLAGASHSCDDETYDGRSH
ncbi:MAG: hypothetical protein OXH06_07420 [Gemmatimonadetes bacterium]|nr:hypothetical protein [Gemmatimonadota bacterium]